QNPNLKNLFLDIGVSTKEAAQKLGITIGNMITPVFIKKSRELTVD
ncbi:MAG: hypothetical protein Q8730_02660, partial [Sweet potato little leaf phytoplasma]|nr:hypothetical protein [Sweet potato little leaf phytoplasma]